MRALLVALVALGVFGAVGAHAEEAPDPAIAQCIRDNAAAVEQAVVSLNDAVEFLTQKVCAVPVAANAERAREDASKKWADEMKANCERMKANAAKSDEDATMCDQNFDYSGFTLVAMRGALPETPAPADATALAAKLLLDLRLAHKNKTH